MAKRVFVVDDPTIAAEVENLLRSKGLNRTSQRNVNMPSVEGEDVEFPYYKRPSTSKEVTPSPFGWRDGNTTPNPQYRRMGPGVRGIERIPQMKRPSIDEEHLAHVFNHIMSQPSRQPFESSCGTFNPEPHPTSRLFVSGACGSYVPADARDLAMGRQLYTSNGCGGFDPIPQRPHSSGGCGGWSAPSYGGCGGTTYMSGC